MGDQIFVKRDKNQQIFAISTYKENNDYEAANKDDPDVIQFLEQQSSTETEPIKELAKSDIEMVRVIDDLIELLIHKQLINFTDLPEATQQKILKRKKIREMLRAIT